MPFKDFCQKKQNKNSERKTKNFMKKLTLEQTKYFTWILVNEMKRETFNKVGVDQKILEISNYATH